MSFTWDGELKLLEGAFKAEKAFSLGCLVGFGGGLGSVVWVGLFVVLVFVFFSC